MCGGSPTGWTTKDSLPLSCRGVPAKSPLILRPFLSRLVLRGQHSMLEQVGDEEDRVDKEDGEEREDREAGWIL